MQTGNPTPVQRAAAVLSLTGAGYIMWFGQGFPTATGPAVFVAGGIGYAFLLALPIYAFLRWKLGVLTQVFGRLGLLLMGLLALGLAPYIMSIERLGRFELLGSVLSVLALLVLLCAGLKARGSGFLGLCHFALPIGYGMTGGSILAGQVQAGLAMLFGLGLLQSLSWSLGARPKRWPMGALLAFGLPIGMILTLRIGHVTAVPLLLSYLTGATLNWPSTRSKSPEPRE